jgi:hypothetical protein
MSPQSAPLWMLSSFRTAAAGKRFVRRRRASELRARSCLRGFSGARKTPSAVAGLPASRLFPHRPPRGGGKVSHLWQFLGVSVIKFIAISPAHAVSGDDLRDTLRSVFVIRRWRLCFVRLRLFDNREVCYCLRGNQILGRCPKLKVK